MCNNFFFSFKVFYMDQKVQISITYIFRIACPCNYLIRCARNPPIMYKNIIFLENIAYRVNTLMICTSQISFRLYEYHELPKIASGLLFANISFCWAYFREDISLIGIIHLKKINGTIFWCHFGSHL